MKVRWIGRDLSPSGLNQPPLSDGIALAFKNAQVSTCGVGTTAGSGGVGAGLLLQRGQPGCHGVEGGNPTSGRARANIGSSVGPAAGRDLAEEPHAAMADDGTSTPKPNRRSAQRPGKVARFRNLHVETRQPLLQKVPLALSAR